MARAGRPRKPGPRDKRGRLIQKVDAGTKRAQKAREIFGLNCADALGRAYASGLLGADMAAKAMLDTGRSMSAAYHYRYGVGRIRCPLGGPTGGGQEDPFRAMLLADWLDERLSAVGQYGPSVRAAFDDLVIAEHPDTGPDWLDRIIQGVGNTRDIARLARALEGLGAII